MHRRSRITYVIVAGAVLMVMIAMSPGGATARPEWTGAAQGLLDRPRAQTPEDRYAMAGGCYAIRSAAGGYVIREGASFAATGTSLESAEPFHFQATDLGRYLLFDSSEDFVAASEGLAGEAAYGVTRSTPGATAGGLVMEETDKAADDVARSPVNEATGRGASVVAAGGPSDLADWEIDDAGDGGFSLMLPETGQALATDDEDKLVLEDGAADDAVAFAFELMQGCASFPEVEINVDGPVLGGQTSFQEVRGFVDAHLHMMAFEFIGGRVRCGRPWHRFGVAAALVDCPDHEPGGHGAVLEAVLSGGDPVTGHNTDGWPTFEGWPRPGSLTHEQVYYKWLERAWPAG